MYLKLCLVSCESVHLQTSTSYEVHTAFLMERRISIEGEGGEGEREREGGRERVLTKSPSKPNTELAATSIN